MSNDLWAAAGLEDCEVGPTDKRVVPVLLEDGDGSVGSPWNKRSRVGDGAHLEAVQGDITQSEV